MADKNAIGHRNYAEINVETLTAEEKAAVESAKSYNGLYGIVPYTYYNEGEYDVFYHHLLHTMGYTIVMDKHKKIRFIQKGFLNEDEVSLLNKGNTVEFLVNWYHRLIFEATWL